MSANEDNQNIVGEKRVRKTVQRLSEVFNKEFNNKSESKMNSTEGHGIKLGDIVRVKDAFLRSRIDKDVIKVIHRLCYKSPGSESKRNTNIKKFNGFEDNEHDTSRRVALCEKINQNILKVICDLFNIDTKDKHKKEIAVSIIDYLKCPFETGSTTFRTHKLKKKTKKVKGTGKKLKSKNLKQVTMEDVEMLESVASESYAESEEVVSTKKERLYKKESSADAEQENKVIKKVQKKKEKIMNKVSEVIAKDGESDSLSDIDSEEIVKPTKGNKSKTLEKVNKNISPKKEHVSDDESVVSKKNVDMLTDENTINVKFKIDEISDESITSNINNILKGADLNVLTLNQVCDEVIGKFPEVNLVSKRAHIKQLVKKVIEAK